MPRGDRDRLRRHARAADGGLAPAGPPGDVLPGRPGPDGIRHTGRSPVRCTPSSSVTGAPSASCGRTRTPTRECSGMPAPSWRCPRPACPRATRGIWSPRSSPVGSACRSPRTCTGWRPTVARVLFAVEESGGPDENDEDVVLRIGEWDARGALCAVQSIPLERATWQHDVGVTATHMVFVESPTRRLVERVGSERSALTATCPSPGRPEPTDGSASPAGTVTGPGFAGSGSIRAW